MSGKTYFSGGLICQWEGGIFKFFLVTVWRQSCDKSTVKLSTTVAFCAMSTVEILTVDKSTVYFSISPITSWFMACRELETNPMTDSMTELTLRPTTWLTSSRSTPCLTPQPTPWLVPWMTPRMAPWPSPWLNKSFALECFHFCFPDPMFAHEISCSVCLWCIFYLTSRQRLLDCLMGRSSPPPSPSFSLSCDKTLNNKKEKIEYIGFDTTSL